MAELRLRSPRAYRLSTVPVSIARDGDGCSLQRAIAADVVRPLIADRADAYFAILVALLTAKREGEDAPTLDELRRRVRLDDGDEATFLRDLLQLEAWGCLKRELEPSRIRGYSDARRDRYRHRLADDAAAFIGWLEARSLEKMGTEKTGVAHDARERFADVITRLVELTSLVSMDEGENEARRAQHLTRSIEVELDAIERSLVRLDVELRTFAERAFDAGRLKRIVVGLEEFLREHITAVEPARASVALAIEALRAAGFCGRWAGWSRAGTFELSYLVDISGKADGDALLAAWEARITVDGTLDRLARRVEASARSSITALRRHVRLVVDESRSTGACIDRAIRLLAAHDDGRTLLLALWGQRAPIWAPGSGQALTPPLPRRRAHAVALEPIAIAGRPRAASPPRAEPSPEVGHRIARAWLDRIGAQGEVVALSALDPSSRRDPDALRAWMTIARARHLGRGRALTRLGVRVVSRPGVVTLGDDTAGLVAPDCDVSITSGAVR